MKAYVFSGQGTQFVGMGKDLYEKSESARKMFIKANQILDFPITDLMFTGTDENLRQTKITQPAVFLHSVILVDALGEEFKPDMVAGHSLGEFSALVAAKALSFEDGLRLVAARAIAMQQACEIEPSTMVAILGLENAVIEEIINSIDEVVVVASYNCSGQLVISGSEKGVGVACEKLKVIGAKHVLPLKVGGAFHSPIMEPARVELAKMISQTSYNQPICPIYQNVNAKPTTNQVAIRENLIAQLTSPVYWHQTVLNMVADGARTFIEVGPGNVLQGLIRRIVPKADVSGVSSIP